MTKQPTDFVRSNMLHYAGWVIMRRYPVQKNLDYFQPRTEWQEFWTFCFRPASRT